MSQPESELSLPSSPGVPRVIIVGGGLAGLAAASALVTRGIPVTVLESRPRLGGRASSFLDPTTGQLIDNCQHVNLGCGTNFTHFCEQTGIANSLKGEPVLYFIGPAGTVTPLRESWLPAPLHLAGSFARLPYFTWREKIRLALGVRALVQAVTADRGETIADWLTRHRQSLGIVQRFWQVILVSALSESLDRISVLAARKVLVDGFLKNREGWRMQVPAVPLDDLYTTGVGDWLRSRGADVRLKCGTAEVVIDEGKVQGVRTRAGETLSGRCVILATPPDRARELLPDPLAGEVGLTAAGDLPTAPISSVHFWSDRPFSELPHAVLVDHMSQWWFNRGSGPLPDGRLAYYSQVVISASHALEGIPQAEIISHVQEELASLWPAARAAQLLHARVITEHKAVLSMLPGIDDHRLPQATCVPGLVLAGDWTRTGWPSTMEGAVRSGYFAAERVLESLGKPDRCLQADLPAGRFARWCWGRALLESTC